MVHIGLRRSWLAAGVSALLIVGSALTSVPAMASAPKRYPFRTPQLLDPVPVSKAPPSKPVENVAAHLAAVAAPIKPPVWPQANVAEVNLAEKGQGAAKLSVGGAAGLTLSVSSKAAAGSGALRRVKLETLDQAAIAKTGRSGLAVRLSRVDGGVEPATAEAAVDYSAVAGAYGGDWASRLRAVVLPECALSTPAAPGCEPVQAPSRNDTDAGVVVAEVAVNGGAGTVLMLTAGDSSVDGNFTATKLSPSATWVEGGSAGDFAWSYPLVVPPSLGGPAPSIEFSYSSQSVDGMTSATNNQPSWLGDGFSYSPGFIERRYKSCADDGHAGIGDRCWGPDNATLVLSGHGGELVPDPANPDVWRPVKDDGTRVQRLRDTATGNGDNDGEYWKVTTPEGTQFFFGRNRITGWQSGSPETNSVSYMPVFGDDSGEPCFQASFSDAWCQQAYRWNLDQIVDTHGNTASFWYTREMNNYGRNANAASVSPYVRESYLSRVDYGTDNRSGVDSALSGTPPQRVVFNVVDRCAQAAGCQTHDPAHWPDVPWDRQCTSSTSCLGVYAPTFFSTMRLASVVTKVATGVQTFKDVDSWTLGVQWLPQGDTGNPSNQDRIMWLNTITRTGLNGSAPDIALPDVMLNPTQTLMPNRVNAADGRGVFRRYRLATIANETGGSIGISYSAPDCVPGSKMPASPETNTYRCAPTYWTPPGGSQILDYFHKYVVTGTSLADNAGHNAPQYTSYAYPPDGAFWHYDTSALTPPERRSWSQWRGYEQVTTTVGDLVPGQPQLVTVAKYLRGRHGDKLPSGTRTQTYTVNGQTLNDEDWLAGRVREQTILNGPNGATVSSTFTEPYSSGPTATRTVEGITTSAYAVDTLRTTTRTTLDGGRPDRVTAVTNGFTDGADGTPRGRLLTVDDEGDTATPSDDMCTRNTYARNDTANIHTLLAQVEVTGLRCSVTANNAADVLSLTRTWYDGGGHLPHHPHQR